MIGERAYIEDCNIGHHVTVGTGCVLSNLAFSNQAIPADTALHGIHLKNGNYVVRAYGVLDNPKGTLEKDAPFLGTTLQAFLSVNGLTAEKIWGKEEHYLWFANLYPVCDSMEEAVKWALCLVRMAAGQASGEEIESWKASERLSLYSSFNRADVQAIVPWKRGLENRVMVEKFVDHIQSGMFYQEALKDFGEAGINEE